ncbi:hypothetical protein BY458DRAFT_502128 [Sporodiniella umbellata]|nr:hypothetical protein BY458DRAFT_502128 [Sporodiniella umbellata]
MSRCIALCFFFFLFSFLDFKAVWSQYGLGRVSIVVLIDTLTSSLFSAPLKVSLVTICLLTLFSTLKNLANYLVYRNNTSFTVFLNQKKSDKFQDGFNRKPVLFFHTLSIG